jgi:DNA-directed RNA polymerase subunit RPC12/RpoP
LTVAPEQFRRPCSSCGAGLAYKPGTALLECPYCGFKEAIEEGAVRPLEELDMTLFLDRAHSRMQDEEEKALRCSSCGAEFRLGADRQAGDCPFCGSNVVVEVECASIIPPNGVMPFGLDPRQARDCYRKWISSRFWAPNNLKRLAEQSSTLHPLYVPYWTYDALTSTTYTGQRGDDYLDTETYYENGESKTRTVTKTRWSFAAGTVEVPFDDLLVLASTKVPRKYTQNMQNWGLQTVTGYQPQFLSGYEALRYDIGLSEGFDLAKGLMKPGIESAIRYDIGGDRQRISSMDTTYFNVTFKHVLLPIYSGAYRYSKKIWRFFINGQSGQVAGEAPVSWWKVTLAVLLGLIVAGAIYYFFLRGESGSTGFVPSSRFEWSME